MVSQPPITAVSDCHLHGSSVFCLADATEYLVRTTATATSDLPPSFTGCHSHGSETFCLSPDGEEVEIELVSEHSEDGTNEESHGEHKGPNGERCHFHAGVEHCVGGDSHKGSKPKCERVDRNYNIPLRAGLLFVILATSAIGVFAPIVLVKFFPSRLNTTFAILKQFGTGVIISTAFVHLLTHASLMFENPCLGETAYESTAAAILMAGLFLSFLVEYLGQRLVQRQVTEKIESDETTTTARSTSTEMVNIMVLEAGIIFHSLIIGLTLVVAGDSFFLILFAVIVFHQMFEGIALGTRIAALGNSVPLPHTQSQNESVSSSSGPEATKPVGVSTTKKFLLAAAFALVTPLGMAIGLGALKCFNGNDPATIVAIGTLDAFSAGILVWVGVVEMWAVDWMLGGEMTGANATATTLGLGGLVAGMALMSVLGKWA